jgi:hypothetical protein
MQVTSTHRHKILELLNADASSPLKGCQIWIQVVPEQLRQVSICARLFKPWGVR